MFSGRSGVYTGRVRLSAEDYLNHLAFELSEGEIFTELFGPLIGLEDEWRAQGASNAELDMTGFGWDYVETAATGIDFRARSGLEETVLEDNARERVVRDTMGRVMRLPKQRATIALPESFPVASVKDWEAIRHWFRDAPDRVNPARVDQLEARRADGALIRSQMWGAYDLVRQLMGDEEACIAFIEQPELVEDMLRTVGDMLYAIYDRLTRRLRIDFLSVHEDFAGKSGPLVGPAMVKRFFEPYYRRIWNLVRERGGRIFDLDTDGNMEPVLDALLDCGINSIHPLEPAAGVDVVRIRKRYGKRLALRGGIDKFVLRKGEAAIREELEYKMQPCMRGGGTVFALDHRIPNGTPLEAYRFYVRAGRKMLGKPPLEEDAPGWRRMA